MPSYIWSSRVSSSSTIFWSSSGSFPLGSGISEFFSRWTTLEESFSGAIVVTIIYDPIEAHKCSIVRWKVAEEPRREKSGCLKPST